MFLIKVKLNLTMNTLKQLSSDCYVTVIGFYFLIILCGCSSPKLDYTAQKEYIDEVLGVIEDYSLYRESLHIEKIRKEAYAQLKGTNSIEDCYPIIQNFLKQVDNHSLFILKENSNLIINTDLTDSIQQYKYFSGQLLTGNIGYINMLGFYSGNIPSLTEYANTLQSLISSIDNDSLNGWICAIILGEVACR